MIEFHNSKNTNLANKALSSVIWIGFFLSTLTSSVSLSLFATKLMSAILGEYAESYPFWYNAALIALVAGIIRFCYIVDFLIINNIGKQFATEAFAALGAYRGVFSPFGVYRSASMVFYGIIFTGGFALSFITSLNGASLIKAFVAPKISAQGFEQVAQDRGKESSSLTKSQDSRIAKLEDERNKAVNGAGNKELIKMAGKGNGWAQMTLDSMRTAAAKPYDKQIAAIEKQRSELIAKFEAKYAPIEKAKIAAAEAEVSSTMSQAQAIGTLTTGFGVLPLIIGVLGLVILSISEVAAAAAKSSNSGHGNSGNGHGNNGHGNNRSQHNNAQTAANYGGSKHNSYPQNFP